MHELKTKDTILLVGLLGGVTVEGPPGAAAGFVSPAELRASSSSSSVSSLGWLGDGLVRDLLNFPPIFFFFRSERRTVSALQNLVRAIVYYTPIPLDFLRRRGSAGRTFRYVFCWPFNEIFFLHSRVEASHLLVNHILFLLIYWLAVGLSFDHAGQHLSVSMFVFDWPVQDR